MRGLILRWVLNAIAILLVAALFPGIIKVDNVGSAMVAALVLGILNAIIRPVIILFTLPISIVTLGLFTLVINGFMLAIVHNVVKGFQVSGFLGAIGGAILLSIFSGLLNWLVKDKEV